MNKESRAHAFKYFVDVSIFIFSFFAAFFIADEGIPDPPALLPRLLLLGSFVVFLRILCFSLFSVFPITWKFFSTDDAVVVVKSVLPVTAVLFLGRVFLPASWPLWRFPWSVVFLEFLFVLLWCLGVRLADRLAYERAGRVVVKKKLLLIGAGTVGARFVRDLERKINPEIEVIGFVDDDPGKYFSEIWGKRVLGNISQIPKIVQRLDFDEAVLTINTLPPEDLRRIIRAFWGTKAKLTWFRHSYEPLYDETCLPPEPAEDPEAVVWEQMKVFKELTGRDYDPNAETAYPIDHPFEVNKPFSDPEGLSGDYVMAVGAMIKLLRLRAGAAVLDLGCGCGWTTIMLARCGFKVTGTDVNEASLAIGRKNAEKIGVPVSFVRADSQKFSFDQPFDAVVIFDSLHHCLRENEVLARAFAALRPGGKIVLSEQYHTDDDRAAVLTFDAAVQVMRKFGTLEKGLGKRYLIRLLYACGFERAAILTTPGLHGIWITARKPRTKNEIERGIHYAPDHDRALWPYD